MLMGQRQRWIVTQKPVLTDARLARAGATGGGRVEVAKIMCLWLLVSAYLMDVMNLVVGVLDEVDGQGGRGIAHPLGVDGVVAGRGGEGFEGRVLVRHIL